MKTDDMYFFWLDLFTFCFLHKVRRKLFDDSLAAIWTTLAIWSKELNAKTELPIFSLVEFDCVIFIACLCHWNGSWWLVAACSKLPNLLSSTWPEDWGQVRVLWQKYQLPIDVIASPSNSVTSGFDAILEDRTLLQMLTNGLLGHLNLENCYLVTVKHDPWIYTLDNFEIGLEIELALQEWKWVKSASQYPMKFLPSNITQQHLFETNLINKRHTFLKSPKE